MNEKIDIVIPWVDGSDPDWLKEKNFWNDKINPDKNSNSNNRYQSWDNLIYFFRAVESFMPWVNKVFFVTWGHIPEFLNIENKKLQIIRHADYIPQKYLPTFNVNAIELNLHRIQDLSENFIYFNDDTFPLMPVDKEYYFSDNLPCDEAVETPIIPILAGEISQYTWNMRALDTAIINKHFNKRDVQRENRDKWFCDNYEDLLERNRMLSYWDNFVGFRDPHLPVALKKSTFEKVWKAEPEMLEKACISKFRNYDCVNQWLIRYWQICEGNFIPRKTLGQSYVLNIQNYEDISDIILKQTQPMICINEECFVDEFELIKSKVNATFEKVLPGKSSFEK